MIMPRPLPRFPEPETQPFWDATKDHKLTYPQCRDCNTVIWFPRSWCPSCGSRNLEWKESKGQGTVYTYSVIRQNRNPAFKDLGAYALAYIDLDEGFRIMSNVTGVSDPTKDISVGMKVKVQWEDQPNSDIALPLFAPA